MSLRDVESLSTGKRTPYPCGLRGKHLRRFKATRTARNQASAPSAIRMVLFLDAYRVAPNLLTQDFNVPTCNAPF
jgi:hypothetical protein